mgnify:CR=1 FL=1
MNAVAAEQYELFKEEAGRGSYGVVKKARDTTDGKLYVRVAVHLFLSNQRIAGDVAVPVARP